MAECLGCPHPLLELPRFRVNVMPLQGKLAPAHSASHTGACSGPGSSTSNPAPCLDLV